MMDDKAILIASSFDLLKVQILEEFTVKYKDDEIRYNHTPEYVHNFLTILNDSAVPGYVNDVFVSGVDLSEYTFVYVIGSDSQYNNRNLYGINNSAFNMDGDVLRNCITLLYYNMERNLIADKVFSNKINVVREFTTQTGIKMNMPEIYFEARLIVDIMMQLMEGKQIEKKIVNPFSNRPS